MTNSLDGARYAQLLLSARVHDRSLLLPLRTPNEFELQARWFASEFGKNFVSTGGDKIDIVQFGRWNHEAGPDFKDAAVRVNGGEPRRGCIEIDLIDRSWETHGHSTNPAFDQTMLHDADYDNQITNPYTADTGAGSAAIRQGVVTWSIGKDKTQGTNFNTSDDVISLQ